jgi:hypothetical protein
MSHVVDIAGGQSIGEAQPSDDLLAEVDSSLAYTRAPVEIRKNPLDFLRRSAHKSCTVIPPQGGRIMRIKKLAAFATTLVFVALALNVSAAAADQQSGTWKMNAAKSKYSPGPAPKSITVNINSEADNIKLSSDGIDAAGNPTHIEYTAKYDGKDYPITGVPNADTVALQRLDASTTQSTLKKADQVVMTVTSVVSKDGKTRTSTFKGKDAKGQDVNNIVVYNKQ